MTETGETHNSSGWTPDDGSFGARLALIRQRMKWGNVKEAADAVGLPTESWRSWERDGRTPRNIVDIAATIAEKTGCDYLWLLTGNRTDREGRLITTSRANVVLAGPPNVRSGFRAERAGRTGPLSRTHADESMRRPVRTR